MQRSKRGRRCAKIRTGPRFANSFHRVGTKLESLPPDRLSSVHRAPCSNSCARPFHQKHIASCRPSPAYHFLHEAQTVQSLSQIGCRPEGDFTHLCRNVLRGRGHPGAVRQRKGNQNTYQQKGVHRPVETARRFERAITRASSRSVTHNRGPQLGIFRSRLTSLSPAGLMMRAALAFAKRNAPAFVGQMPGNMQWISL